MTIFPCWGAYAWADQLYLDEPGDLPQPPERVSPVLGSLGNGLYFQAIELTLTARKKGPDGTREQIIRRFSTIGYVDETGTPWPPLVAQGVDIARSLTFSADALGGSYSLGNILLINPAEFLDEILDHYVNDRLPVRILEGEKKWDYKRQIWCDPPLSELRPVFVGLGKVWQPSLMEATIPIQDVTALLTTAMQVATYGGTGKLDGEESLKGRNQPRLRGFAVNITPVLVDSVNYVYQLSDGRAQIFALYEGGYAGGITWAKEVDDLYQASPAPGTYVTQTKQNGTFFRLGSKPVYAITVDAEGWFRSGVRGNSVLALLRRFLFEDLGLDQKYISPAWSPALHFGNLWPGGWYWDGSQSVTGKDAVSTLLSGLAVSLIPAKDGTLLLYSLHTPGGKPYMKLTEEIITSVASVALDDSLAVPVWRWRIGWQHNFTIQKTGQGLSPRVAGNRQNVLGQSDQLAVWQDDGLKEEYARPGDPDQITTPLAIALAAQKVVELYGAIWGTERRIYAVELPRRFASALDLGDIVELHAPVPGAHDGVLGIVVSEQAQSEHSAVTLNILI